MKTYIINLKRSVNRKNYINRLIEPYSLFQPEFIEGVDGKMLSEEERNKLFDSKKARMRYGRACNPGEQGCTLSHQKCYHKLLDSTDQYALILEDDITFNSLVLPVIEKILPEMDVESPLIILLSGGYWYSRKDHVIDKNFNMVKVYDAYYTHSYLINKAAAKLLQHAYPFFLADDWKYIRSLGIIMKAIQPHLISQRQRWEEGFESLIYMKDAKISKNSVSIKRKIEIYYEGGVKKLLKLCGRYENTVGGWS